MGSLFAGIGGFELGFERSGFTTVWQVEIDSYCRRVLAKHFPHAERFADVRHCGRHNLRPVDVICGGFPCQDISNAGLRAGMDGERSGLWTEFWRIIGELRPRYVVVENVAALLGRGIGRVLGDLSEIGYDAEWEVISAADVGAPHLRERVWIVAHSNSDGRRRIEQGRRALWGDTDTARHGENWNVADAERISEWSGLCANESTWERRGRLSNSGSACDVADAAGARFAKGICEPGRQIWHDARGTRPERLGCDVADASGTGCEEFNPTAITAGSRHDTGSTVAERGADWWAVEPNVDRVAYGIPARVDRLRALGNAVVPQITERIARRLVEVMQVL